MLLIGYYFFFTHVELHLKPIEYRLVEGSNSSRGRIEVRYNGIWGTICDNFWDTDDAKVACRQLGLPYREAQAIGGGLLGQGVGQIWLNDVQCVGNESRLDECRHAGWGVHDCSHRQDAGVICTDGKCQ